MKRRSSFSSRSTTNGFTLIEVLVTVVLIGILFAIAAPNWVAFLNQQRVGSARNQVSQAIRTAQSQAQQTKTNRAVVFDNNNNQPRYAIVPVVTDTVDTSTINNWQNLGDGTIQKGTMRLRVNQGTPSVASPLPAALIFDSFGSVIVPKQLPFTVTIGSTLSANPKRCAEVVTLLGAIREGSNDVTAAAPNDGCPAN